MKNPMFTSSPTSRGFACYIFEDYNQAQCSIQESSAGSTHAIWLGIQYANPMIMARDAQTLGIETDQSTGWISYSIPEQVQITTRMHLNRQKARKLAEMLMKFADTGILEP